MFFSEVLFRCFFLLCSGCCLYNICSFNFDRLGLRGEEGDVVDGVKSDGSTENQRISVDCST